MLPWLRDIRKTHQLTIFNGINQGRWVHVFHKSIKAFNELSDKYILGVTFVEESDADKAQVVMRVADGPVSFTHGGKTNAGTFDGKRLHGLTMLFGEQIDVVGHVEYARAAIFLPSKPDLDVKPAAAIDMMNVIAVHELVHACGLDNDDHAGDGLFYSPLSQSGDKLIVPERGKNLKPLPPLWLDQPTIKKVKMHWVGLIDI